MRRAGASLVLVLFLTGLGLWLAGRGGGGSPAPARARATLPARWARIRHVPGDVGRFGYRLLVTATARGGASVFGVDCAGRVTTIASHAPRVEGGIAVAPLSFGSFGGDLVAPDETTGQVWAIGPGGKTRLIARSPLPAGGDVGVESAAFVPAGFGRDWAAYVADRGSPGNRHPGTDSILRLPGAELVSAGIRAGELVVTSEGGAQTIVINCSATACTVRHIADWPTAAHVEGHIVFAPHR